MRLAGLLIFRIKIFIDCKRKFVIMMAALYLEEKKGKWDQGAAIREIR
jgi:hypothetical protein